MIVAKLMAALAVLLVAGMTTLPKTDLPNGFVHLADVAPGILEDMRYASAHNFTGKVVDGYEAPACILTEQAAAALARVEVAVEAKGYRLMVWDCYRPKRAVAAFVAWAEGPDTAMMAEFYPRVPKSELFTRGYIAAHSRHSLGSTMDLTLAPIALKAAPIFPQGAPLVDCISPYGTRFNDGAIDMGTGFDCFDERAHAQATTLSATAQANRKILRDAMVGAGFDPYAEEWWHFTLKNEPFPDQPFDFPVK